MRLVFSLVLILGLGLAGVAVYVAQGRISEYQQLLEQQKAELKKQIPLVRVAVVKRAIDYGEKLAPKDVALVPWPKVSVPEGAFTDVKKLFPDGDRVLRSVVRRMEKGEPILAAKVTEPGKPAGVAAKLGKGMRAFAIRVDVASGVSGFLRPGDRVDVFWTGELQGQRVTKLIEEDIRLIAVDQIADSDRAAPVVARTVTVEVTPAQVAALAQAQATGTLYLSLRNQSDDTVAGNLEIDQNKLLGIVEKPKVAEAPKVEKKVCTIRTRKGAEVVEIPIPCTD
ncbi:MAG: Flp pilus assembly protein CpaB [Alphaproteobacteria bacterium]|nr:MAG: Flp pilus assembly protein CpaB [Alphaproteobacteria bacterium]